MVQNHLMQLLTLVAMEPPIAFTAESVRDRKMDALLAVQPIVGGDEHRRSSARNIARLGGRQGGAGLSRRSRVSRPTRRPRPSSRCGESDSWRWAGVPFYLRTGKRLPKRTTEIAIQFQRPPLQIFKRVSPTPWRPTC